MQLIKGESSFWTNKHYQKLEEKLNWQKEYFAVSFGESQLETMRGYLKKQVQHHQHKSFDEEVDEFITKYNFMGLSLKKNLSKLTRDCKIDFIALSFRAES